VGAVVVNTYVAQSFAVPSPSMAPTLQVGDRVLALKFAYRFRRPRRGDIVVFAAPSGVEPNEAGNGAPRPGANQLSVALGRALRQGSRALGRPEPEVQLVKRVVALAGETVEAARGTLRVDGFELSEPYLAAGTTTGDFGPVAVPPERLWVMGDNRSQSRDSRVFGPIADGTVVGLAVWRLWPGGRLSSL
jgi:signal peptidase I